MSENKTTNTNQKMSNEYAKDYYDSYLRDLDTDYKSARWFKTPATKLDFDQTTAVLQRALKGVSISSALEVGPGDGVWTDLLIPRTQKLTLLDQSIEMINRAKERLSSVDKKIEYVNEDFLQYHPDKQHDLLFLIRCFEYFEDKELAAKTMADLLNTGGLVVIVTKNPEHARISEIHDKDLHRGQIKRSDMEELLKKHGFVIEQILSATWRFKANNVIMRGLFRGLHWLHVKTGGLFVVPFCTKPLTESYIYVARKK